MTIPRRAKMRKMLPYRPFQCYGLRRTGSAGFFFRFPFPILIFIPEMSIQWFPGHMTSARKKAAETLAQTDVVIEVLDARLPEASCNPMIRALREFRQRPCLKPQILQGLLAKVPQNGPVCGFRLKIRVVQQIRRAVKLFPHVFGYIQPVHKRGVKDDLAGGVPGKLAYYGGILYRAAF
jgi:hypothetical protein